MFILLESWHQEEAFEGEFREASVKLAENAQPLGRKSATPMGFEEEKKM